MDAQSTWGFVILGILVALTIIVLVIAARKRQQERNRAETARKRAELERNRANARRMYDDLEPRARKRKVAVLQQDGTPALAERSYSRKTRSTPTHPHSYVGGNWNGEYYGPGYYSEPFWTYIIVAGMLDSDAGNSDSHNPSTDSSNQWWGDSDNSTPEPTPVPTSTPSSSGSDWDGSSSYDSGSSFSSSYDSGGWSGGGYDGGSSGGGDSGGGGGGD